uniref:Terpene synthase 4 n=1 Tax=Aconitum carmichaelii TaxID=85363 RepID=A0A8E8P259_ACOCM|nr:terpene synthase 4 [Aconitum carmichaelii]
MSLSRLNFLPTCFSSTDLFFPKQLPQQQKYHLHALETSKSNCQASAGNNKAVMELPTERRSAHFKPNIWTHQFMQTLTSDYQGQVYLKKADVLKDKVRHLLDDMSWNKKEGLAFLELIDDIQRLGLGYNFEKEIRRVLSFLLESNLKIENTLHATALSFRLYRQHGFQVSQDVFNGFMDPQGNFMEHLSQDVKGMLSLFEASYLGVPGENILDEAKAFAHKHLSHAKGNTDTEHSQLVNRYASDLPLHYNIIRLQARWYIDVYSRRKNGNPTLLELAKLDFNIVQATYQNDLIEMSRWWENLGLMKELLFTRDRLVESFIWAVGMADEPQYTYCRQGITKIIILITTIDDVYDVYSTYDEAKLFTEAVERWDVSAVDQLPEYMKLCFFALYNTINEFAYDVLKTQGLNVLPYLKKKWANQCKSYLVESKWFHTGYKPTLDEYLENAWVSITGPMINLHAYVFMTPNITKEALDYLDSSPDLIYWSSMILRLTDDLATSKDEMERGDVPKSIQCYMNHEGVIEEVAREHIRHLADEAWKKVNAELWIDSPLPEAFIREVVNFIRTGEIFYDYGDAHGIPEVQSKDRVFSLIIDAIPIP